MVNLVSDFTMKETSPMTKEKRVSLQEMNLQFPSERDTVVERVHAGRVHRMAPLRFLSITGQSSTFLLYNGSGTSAYEKARAIRDENERLVSWCADQINQHRLYSRVGAITLNE